MKILVTGASGFIGREVITELVAGSHQVIGLKHLNGPLKLGLTVPNLQFVDGDITNFKSLLKLSEIENIDVIIHTAGLAHQFGDIKKEEFELVNVKGTENILNAGIKVGIKHFILIASTAVYGVQKSFSDLHGALESIGEDAPLAPPTLYAKSKLGSENICRQICERNQIPLTIFRLAPVIGEDNAGNVARLIEAIDQNRFVWIGNGQNLKSLIYKKDVARACATVITLKKCGTEIFNLAAAPVKMKDFVGEIAANLNKKVIPLAIPKGLPRLLFRLNDQFLNIKRINKLSETVEKWLANDVYSADKFTRAYNFQPQTPIKEAIARQVKRYKANKI